MAEALALLPESVVRVGPRWTLAVNRNQDLLGKSMLVLRRPCTAVVDVMPDEWTALHDEVRTVVTALTSLFRPDQFNFAFLMNQDAQVHLHVVPRYAGERTWAGERFVDAHWGEAFGHEQRPLPTALLTQLTDEVRAAVGA